MNLKSTLKYELGGKERELRLDMNMLCELEDALDKPVMSSESFWKNLGFREIRTMVWAMLYAEEQRPSLREVGEWLSAADFSTLTSEIMKTWSADLEKVEGDQKQSGHSVNPTQV